MFCSECGTELKEGAKFCQGCGKQREIPKKQPQINLNNGWAMIVGGVILIGVGLYFVTTSAHDISLGEGVLGQFWLQLHGETLGGLYAYEAGGIVGIILGVIVAILGIRKVR